MAKAEISHNTRVEFCNYCGAPVIFCNSPSCDEETTYWKRVKITQIRIRVSNRPCGGTKPAGALELCCTFCRAPVKFCTSPSCDEAKTYLGIRTGDRWVSVEETPHEDPLQVVKELEKHKLIGYEAKIAETTKDGKKITQRITKRPQESPIYKILKGIRVPDLVESMIKVLIP